MFKCNPTKSTCGQTEKLTYKIDTVNLDKEIKKWYCQMYLQHQSMVQPEHDVRNTLLLWAIKQLTYVSDAWIIGRLKTKSLNTNELDEFFPVSMVVTVLLGHYLFDGKNKLTKTILITISMKRESK